MKIKTVIQFTALACVLLCLLVNTSFHVLANKSLANRQHQLMNEYSELFDALESGSFTTDEAVRAKLFNITDDFLNDFNDMVTLFYENHNKQEFRMNSVIIDSKTGYVDTSCSYVECSSSYKPNEIWKPENDCTKNENGVGY